MAARDKTPNATLKYDVSYAKCDTKECNNHATLTKTIDGVRIKRCIEHNLSETERILKRLGFEG